MEFSEIKISSRPNLDFFTKTEFGTVAGVCLYFVIMK